MSLSPLASDHLLNERIPRRRRRMPLHSLCALPNHMLQAIIGVAIGIPVAIFWVRYVKSQLYDITTVNISVMIVAIGVLIFAAAIAGIIPAQHTASIDPVRALH